MLNDPWGQVYLEALASRTPVLGLNRNGLPEITEQGRHGFLVDEASPEAIAEEILRAMSDPDRLARMGLSGQAHVLQNYSWDRVVSEMAAVMSQSQPNASEIPYWQ
jgi:glycosyltransferase involved in cell wall biosynthesis